MKNLILIIALFLVTAMAFETRGDTNPVPMIPCKEECYIVPKEIVDILMNMKDRKTNNIKLIKERI